jgi:hypothetical protein
MNELQRSIVYDWLKGIEKDSSREAQRRLRNELAKKYNLTVMMIEGVVSIMATEEMRKVKNPSKYKGYNYEMINWPELWRI